jgi:hypothetical protein
MGRKSTKIPPISKLVVDLGNLCPLTYFGGEDKLSLRATKGVFQMKAHAFLVKMVVGVFAFLFPWTTAGAAGFPEKPIQVLVGWPVGSSNDTIDRAIAKPLSKILKQPVIVQNVPGAAGALVLGRVKTEKPDGYTLFQTGSNANSP